MGGSDQAEPDQIRERRGFWWSGRSLRPGLDLEWKARSLNLRVVSLCHRWGWCAAADSWGSEIKCLLGSW